MHIRKIKNLNKEIFTLSFEAAVAQSGRAPDSRPNAGG